MHHFVHSHLSYDQIIEDYSGSNFTNQKQKESRIRSKASRDKPFWIQKRKQQHSFTRPTNHTNNITQIEETVNPQNNQSQQILFEESINQSNNKSMVYSEDFQQYQQQFQQSNVLQTSQADGEKNSFNYIQTVRNKNKSSFFPFLPRLHKLSILKKNPLHLQKSNELNHPPTLKATKSTIELREENKKLVRSIQIYRKAIPSYRKNIAILNSQNLELNKMKMVKMRMYDVEYEYNLDKGVQKNKSDVRATQTRIKSVERVIKRKDEFSVLKKGKPLNISKVSRICQCYFQQQPSLMQEYAKLKEHIICKRKQEDINSNRLEEIEQKIAMYKEQLEDLEERSKVGIQLQRKNLYQQLNRKKLVLEYDIQMKKTQFGQKQCKIMLEISQLNNKSSQIQLQIAKINQQRANIVLQQSNKNQQPQKQANFDNRNDDIQQKKDELKIDENSGYNQKGRPNRLLKLFLKKK